MKRFLEPLKKYSSLLPYLALAVAPIPFIYFLCSFFFQMDSLSILEERLERINAKAAQYALNKKREEQFLTDIKTVDHFYIDKHVETLVFLEPEIKRIEALFSHGEYEESLKKRLHTLKEGPNKLAFAEDKIRSADLVREGEFHLQHPVEVNEEDLKKLLSLIEGQAIGAYSPAPRKPQIIIKNFELTKKPLSSQEGVFIINLQMIKREALKGGP
jgi:hypothetical protein